MKVYFVGAGPGDPELLTIKGKKAIEDSPCCIYTGSLVNKAILQYARQDARIFNSASMTLDDVIDVIKEASDLNENVARIHTGDPAIYGAIQEQMQLLDALGIQYEIIPGVSSFTAAAAALKQELTLPGISQTVIITRAQGRTPVPEKEDLKLLAQSQSTLCIFLSVQQIENVAKDLIVSYGEDCPAAVVYKASWEGEESIVFGALNNIADKVKEHDIKKTAMIIVGRVLLKAFERSKLYDSGFSHEYRKGATN